MDKHTFRFSTHIAKCIYQSDSITQRIQMFSNIDLRNTQIKPQIIIHPSFLRETRAKDILQFVKNNQIQTNIRILHALTHIEYNAFMSYIDTIFRFKHITAQLHDDFIRDMREVALEEGSHFNLLRNRLVNLGYDYGCMPVIAKLSLAIKQTEESLIERIGVISLMHEGKGVKAVDKLLGQLDKFGDHQSVEIVKIIKKDEVKHFQIGWKWFFNICHINQQNPVDEIKKINLKFKCNIISPQSSKHSSII